MQHVSLVYETPLTIDQVLSQLTEQPKAIAALTADLPRARLHRSPSRGEWSINDVLAHLRSCGDMWGASSLRAFTKQRAELLALLRPLPKAAWSRRATVTGAGKPRERTVMEYAQWLANHERSHVKHIARMVTSARTGG
jgi:hypothetical protein